MKPFSSAVQKRTTSPGSDSALEILGAPWRLAIIAGSTASLFLVIWAFFGKIPIRVTGLGVLFPAGSAYRYTTSDYSRIHFMFGDWESEKQSWFERVLPKIINIDEMSGKTAIEVSRLFLQKLNYPRDEYLGNSKELYRQIKFPYKVPKNRIILHSDLTRNSSSLINALGRYESTVNTYQTIANEQKHLENLLKKQKSVNQLFLGDLQSLEEIGFISKPSLIENISSINRLESQIVNLRIDASKLNSQKSQDLANLKMALDRFVKESILYSSTDLYIHQTSMNSGDYIPPNVPVITYTKNKSEYPETIPVFFSSKSVSQIKKGNKGYATPIGYPSAEVGGIKVIVDDITQLSVGESQIDSKIGLGGFAESIEKNFISPTLVRLKLEKTKESNSSPTPYDWSIQPTLGTYPELRLGDELSVELVTRTQPPISFVMPFINKLLGMDPPEFRLKDKKTEEKKHK